MPSIEETKSIGLAELINQVKRELLTPEKRRDDPVPLFAVDEIQLELTVSVNREIDGGINIQVLSLGGVTTNEKAQTARVTLKPLLSKEEIVADLRQSNPEVFEQMKRDSKRALTKEL